jgi:hypothetical protein
MRSQLSARGYACCTLLQRIRCKEGRVFASRTWLGRKELALAMPGRMDPDLLSKVSFRPPAYGCAPAFDTRSEGSLHLHLPTKQNCWLSFHPVSKLRCDIVEAISMAKTRIGEFLGNDLLHIQLSIYTFPSPLYFWFFSARLAMFVSSCLDLRIMRLEAPCRCYRIRYQYNSHPRFDQ